MPARPQLRRSSFVTIRRSTRGASSYFAGAALAALLVSLACSDSAPSSTAEASAGSPSSGGVTQSPAASGGTTTGGRVANGGTPASGPSGGANVASSGAGAATTPGSSGGASSGGVASGGVSAAGANTGGAAGGSVAVDPSAELYDPERLPRFDIALSDAGMVALDEDPETYVEAELRYEDETVSRIGLRIKGEGSRRTLDGKAAFKLKFDEFVADQTFRGLRRLTLNNMVEDPSGSPTTCFEPPACPRRAATARSSTSTTTSSVSTPTSKPKTKPSSGAGSRATTETCTRKGR
jgi:hypothetical protein